MIKLTRLSDNKEFVIDGEDKEWRATLIEGIDALATNVYTETPAIGSGEIVTGKYIGRRDITVTAHRSSLIDISAARSIVMEFFNPDDTYTMTIQYNDKTMYIDCELLTYKLPTENIHRPIDLTFTMLCPESYFNSGDMELSFNTGQVLKLGGHANINPIIYITLVYETEFYIYIGSDEIIHVILPDDYFPSQNIPPYTLKLDCRYGTLTNTSKQENLTKYIVSGSPVLDLRPNKSYGIVRFLSNQRQKKSGTVTIPSSYNITVSTSSKIRVLTVTFPDGYEGTYDYSDVSYTHPHTKGDFKIIFTNSGFRISGYSGAAVSYTALLDDTSPNRSIATLKYRELYRGF